VGSGRGVFFELELAHEGQNLDRPGRTDTPVVAWFGRCAA
jgi:hypothetical protein